MAIQTMYGLGGYDPTKPNNNIIEEIEVPDVVKTREEVEATRRELYQKNSDPLFFGWQRGENTEQEWLDAVQAVKDANPYPEAPIN